jgi:GNAT superfamily N-acetyltransferase
MSNTGIANTGIANTGIAVRPVVSKGDRKKFLQVPLDVFADDEAFVPQLFFERGEHIDPKKNPFFEHGEVQLFIAERGGKVVGRISAQINHLHIERYDDATGHFGFLDAIDDIEVFKALLDTASDWLKQRGMKHMVGPFNFSINEDIGVLIDGFETAPCVMMPHALPYFQKHIEALGLQKAKDVFAYRFDGLPDPPRAMQKMVGKVKNAGDLTIRPMSKKNLANELEIIIDIFNDAWSDNWSFVPMTRAEITALGEALKMLVKEDYIAIAEYKGKPTAMAVSLPDINDWIKDLNGRLMPFGVIKILYRMMATPLKSARMVLMGVKREFHGTPIGSAMALAVIEEVRKAHKARGMQRAELSWILEDNTAIRNVIESVGGVAYKTYRVYGREI